MKITDFKKLYFTCTGNTCRSPMAQRVYIEVVKHDPAAKDQVVQSRKSFVTDVEEDGIISFGKKEKETISEGTGKIIIEQYGDEKFVKKHRPKWFNVQDLEKASLVLTMSYEHKENIKRSKEAYTPDARVKVKTLGEALGQPQAMVSDPLGKAYKILRDTKTGRPVIGDDGKPIEIFDITPYKQTLDQLTGMLSALAVKEDIEYATLHDDFFVDFERDYSSYVAKKKREAEWEAKRKESKLASSQEPDQTTLVPLDGIAKATLESNLLERQLKGLRKEQWTEASGELKRRKISVLNMMNKVNYAVNVLAYLRERETTSDDIVRLGNSVYDFSVALGENPDLAEKVRTISYKLFDIGKRITEGNYDLPFSRYQSLKGSRADMETMFVDEENHVFGTDLDEISQDIKQHIDAVLPYAGSSLFVSDREQAFPAAMALLDIWGTVKKFMQEPSVHAYHDRIASIRESANHIVDKTIKSDDYGAGGRIEPQDVSRETPDAAQGTKSSLSPFQKVRLFLS